MASFDVVLFAVLPYVALFLFFVGTIYRYRHQSFSYSSLSSQFLENREHFWAMVPFHYGILVVLFSHVVAFLIPREVILWNSKPLRLYFLEGGMLIFALLALIGLINMVARRVNLSKLRAVTTAHDWVLYFLLLVQVVSGISIAVFHPWGSSWFASIVTPYLWSILKLSPNIQAIQAMPWLVKLHIVNASLLIGFFPFTRLVHILVVPNPYLWRKPQVVRWYRGL